MSQGSIRKKVEVVVVGGRGYERCVSGRKLKMRLVAILFSKY